jgi:uncharacterized membrane protein YhaH (DUF805 family)
MRWVKKIFSFKGRASRGQFWRQCAVALLVYLASWYVLTSFLIPMGLQMHAARKIHGIAPSNFVFIAALAFLFVAFALYIWALVAVAARRYHDLDHPFRFRLVDRSIGLRYMFHRGTVGGNQFGPDPLGKSR